MQRISRLQEQLTNNNLLNLKEEIGVRGYMFFSKQLSEWGRQGDKGPSKSSVDGKIKRASAIA